MLITLEWPPSVNTYYRHIRSGKLAGRTLISENGRKYREYVKASVHVDKPLEGMMDVDITLYPPDNRRRDIDNVLKSLLDSLTHAGVWVDDSQIKRLSIEMTSTKGGKATVMVRPI